MLTTLLLGDLISSRAFVQAMDLPSDQTLQMEQQLHLVHKLLEYGDGRAIAHMDEFFADSVRVHDGIGNGEGEDLDLATITEHEAIRVATLLGREWKLLDTFVAGDVIVCYVQWHGVHVGEYMGLPPTGKEFAVPVVFIYRFQNGKICEMWNSWDRLAVLKQLGDVNVQLRQEEHVR